MDSKHAGNPTAGWRVFFLLLLVSGVFFRFSSMNRDYYRGDEKQTGAMVSGLTEPEIIRKFSNEPIGIKDIQDIQHLDPQRGLGATVQSVVREEPFQPLIYFVFVRWWLQSFGDSVTMARWFSSVMGLLAMAGLYGLCRELFKNSLPGWIGVSLMAVSPFHVAWSRSARPYSLWMLVILIATIALLKALRTRKISSWFFYGFTLGLGFYSHLLFLLVVVAHAVYVVLVERENLKLFLVALIGGFFSFIPWILVMAMHRVPTLLCWAGHSEKIPLKFPFLYLLKQWFCNFAYYFLYAARFVFSKLSNDGEIRLEFSDPLVWGAALLLLMVVSIYPLLPNRFPKKVWLFAWILTWVPAALLILPDLLFGGKRSISARFTCASYLGITFSVAGFFGLQMISSSVWRRRFWNGVLVLILLIGVLSCMDLLKTEQLEEEHYLGFSPKIIKLINEAETPLLITSQWQTVQKLCAFLKPNTRFLIVSDRSKPLNIQENYSDIFLLNYGSPQFFLNQSVNEQEYQLHLLFHEERVNALNKQKMELWRLIKQGV